MGNAGPPAAIRPTNRLLTAVEFHQLADVPPEVEWFANLTNRHTKRVYQNAISDFMRFTGIERPEEFRRVTRAHCIAWRDDLVQRALGGSTIRHRLSALTALFEYLCDKNSVTHNPRRAHFSSFPGLNEAFARQYAMAREFHADTLADKIRETIDGTDDCTVEQIQARRLKFDGYRYLASKYFPRMYADKQLHVGGDGEGPIAMKLSLDWSVLDPPEMVEISRMIRKMEQAAAAKRGTPLIEGEAEDEADYS
jgi:Phage integrase, N-terminal SAM-like domain